MKTACPVPKSKMSQNYLTIYFPDGKGSIRRKLVRIAKRKKKSLNSLLIEIIESYLNLV